MNFNNSRSRETLDGLSRWTTPLIGSAAFLAVLSASCCVLPIALTIVGVGGSWISLLGPFVAYRSTILAIVGIMLLVVWLTQIRRWVGLRRIQPLLLAMLCFATLSFAVALSAPQWEQQASRSLWNYWAQTR